MRTNLQCQFNEDLLQLFVDKVDTELFKTILVEDFKTVDVQHSDAQLLRTGQ